MEAQFNTRDISSQKTNFDYVVASLSPEFAQEVQDLILKPPTANAYDTLKATLVQQSNVASSSSSAQKNLHGDRKPTQLLRRIQKLLGDKIAATDSSFLRELFLLRLSQNVRMVLASSDTTDLNKLAVLADKIAEVAAPSMPSNSSVNSI